MMLYLAVTNDEYELPIAVADTKGELERMTGISRANQAWIRRRMKKGGFKGKYLMREVEDDN